MNTVNELRKQIDELMSTNLEQNAKLAALDSLHAELIDKNKVFEWFTISGLIVTK